MIQQKRHFLMLLGAMKAGTSALFHGLAEHPRILGSLDKEPAYWNREAARGRGLEPYLACWDPGTKPGALWWMEASTDYAKVPVECSPAPRLRNLDAELRFLFVTRNPVERVRSNYEMALAHGWIKHPIHVELDPTTVWFSNYYQQLKPFVDCFGRDSIHVLSHEELMGDPAATLRDVCAFLDLDPEGIPSVLPRVNEAAEHRALWRQLALQRAQAAGQHPTEEVLQRELQRDITPGPEIVEHLHRELDHDLALFQDMFGLDPWTGRRTEPEAMTPVERRKPALPASASHGTVDRLEAILQSLRSAA
ncbi:sulfotransferase [Saltatorellus ferox]